MARSKRGPTMSSSRIWLVPCFLLLITSCVCCVWGVVTPGWVQVECQGGVTINIGVFRVCNASQCDVTINDCPLPAWWRCTEILLVIGAATLVMTTVITGMMTLAPHIAKDSVPVSLAACSFCSGCFLVLAFFQLSGYQVKPDKGDFLQTISQIYHIQCSQNMTSTPQPRTSRSSLYHQPPPPMYLCIVAVSLCFLSAIIQVAVSVFVNTNLSQLEDTGPPSGKGRMFPISKGKGVELEQGTSTAYNDSSTDVYNSHSGRFSTKLLYNQKDS